MKLKCVSLLKECERCLDVICYRLVFLNSFKFYNSKVLPLLFDRLDEFVVHVFSMIFDQVCESGVHGLAPYILFVPVKIGFQNAALPDLAELPNDVICSGLSSILGVHGELFPLLNDFVMDLVFYSFD